MFSEKPFAAHQTFVNAEFYSDLKLHGIHIAKEIAHHKSVTTTQIYVNPARKQIQRAYEDIEVPLADGMGTGGDGVVVPFRKRRSGSGERVRGV